MKNIVCLSVQNPSITETSRNEWAKKKQSRFDRRKQKFEWLFRDCSIKKWNDIMNKNDRKLKDEDSIKDCINDDRKKKQSRLSSRYIIKAETRKKTSRNTRINIRRKNQKIIDELISSIRKKKQMYSKRCMKRWWTKLRLHDSKQMILKKQKYWTIDFKNWKKNINYLYQLTITMNNYFEEMMYRKKRRENEFDQNAKLENRITELEIELSNVQSQRDWALKEIKRLEDCNMNLQRHIDKQLADLQIYRRQFWCLHD